MRSVNESDDFSETVANFIEHNWLAHRDRTKWLAALGEQGWFRIDWPAALGGADWSRERQWRWAIACGQAKCPLPDQRLTLLAPLLIALGTAEQQRLLTKLPETQWRFHFEHADGAANNAVPDGQHLFLVRDDQIFLFAPADNPAEPIDVNRLGTGEAARHMARHQSALCNLQEALTSLDVLREADASQTDLAAYAIEVSALVGLFLRGLDPLVNLRAGSLRAHAAELLQDVIGEYAVMHDERGAGDNEPALPFAEEREYLAQLRSRMSVGGLTGEMTVKDDIHTEMTQ